jgi:hypothetical protein
MSFSYSCSESDFENCKNKTLQISNEASVQERDGRMDYGMKPRSLVFDGR